MSSLNACVKSFFIRFAIFIGLLMFIAPVCLGPWILWAGPRWPKIADPARVRHEATVLCQAGYDGPVPQDAWPETIAALRPRMVVASNQSVNVIISAGGISALPWGYIIWPDTVSRADGGIMKYDTAREKE